MRKVRWVLLLSCAKQHFFGLSLMRDVGASRANIIIIINNSKRTANTTYRLAYIHDHGTIRGLGVGWRGEGKAREERDLPPRACYLRDRDWPSMSGYRRHPACMCGGGKKTPKIGWVCGLCVCVCVCVCVCALIFVGIQVGCSLHYKRSIMMMKRSSCHMPGLHSG
ncbi:hypothetical protein F5X96DRAFT_509785 [Biscogniauxia mediterranea]|nr:hypothetical protein F5X96DRAFT_509785 [Biscogniauxia mediterranea]